MKEKKFGSSSSSGPFAIQAASTSGSRYETCFMCNQDILKSIGLAAHIREKHSELVNQRDIVVTHIMYTITHKYFLEEQICTYIIYLRFFYFFVLVASSHMLYNMYIRTSMMYTYVYNYIPTVYKQTQKRYSPIAPSVLKPSVCVCVEFHSLLFSSFPAPKLLLSLLFSPSVLFPFTPMFNCLFCHCTKII